VRSTIAHQAVVEELQSYLAAQPDILGQVHFSHPARTKLLLNEIRPDPTSDE